MKRNRTYLARLGALVLAAAMLTGCAGQPGGSTEGTACLLYTSIRKSAL